MVSSIGEAMRAARAKLPEQTANALDQNARVNVQYVRNATSWGGFRKVMAWVAFPVGIVAAMCGSYTRRLMLSDNKLPQPIDTGINRSDWKNVLSTSRLPEADIARLDQARAAHVRSVAIKLIGVSGQDQSLRAVWRSPDTSTADLVRLAVACTADRTGEYRKEVFEKLRGDLQQTHQSSQRGAAFLQMRDEFRANEQNQRARIGEVTKPESRSPGLELESVLSGDQIKALGTFGVKPGHFDGIRPLIAQLTRIPAGTPQEQAAWLRQTLIVNQDAARVLVLIPDLLDEKAFKAAASAKDQAAVEPDKAMLALKAMLDKERPLVTALRQLLGIGDMHQLNKAALHSEKKGFFANVGKAVAGLGLKATVNTAFNQLKEKRPEGGSKAADFEKRVAAFDTRAGELASTLEKFVADYDFAPYTQALDGITRDLPPELGSFLSDVLQRYFEKQTLDDKKLMLASLYEQGNSAEPMDHLVALLKGTGPFMQKIVQQLGSQAKDPEVAQALQQLKENLNPIADEDRLVLLSAVMRDLGEQRMAMTNIRVLSSASVAETVAVTLTPEEGQPGEPREVIVKLLRPGIVHRAGRERAFFEEVAAARGKEGPGKNDALARTMGSIADQIESELDLRFEAREIENAQAYARQAEVQAGGLRVMQMAAGQTARADFLILEKMPGRSVKSTITSLEAVARNPSATPEELQTSRQEAATLCQRLVELNTLWFKEAFYGSGFFHGDLHAGNLMFDSPLGQPATLGMIDFGNAATLDAKTQRDFLRLQAAVFKGHPELSVDALRGLLPPDARARLDQVRPMLVRELKGLMVKDEIYDDSIARLEADLTGEFLSAATRLGLEIPGSLLQFGRSQTMLDDTFRRAHKALVELSQRPPPITPAVEERAFDDAGDAAVAGSTWAVVRKAGLGFGLGVSSKAAYRGMLDELQDHPVFISTMAYYNAAKEARDVLENDVQAERTDRQELVHRHVHEWAMDGEFFEDEKWAVYVDALPVELRQSPHLTKFKDMCLTPPQAYKSKEGDWETFRPFFQGQSALLDGVLGSLESLFQFEREYEQKRVALPPADPIGKVLAFEREKFLAALQGERPAEVPEVREKAAVEEIKLPNEGVAEKLQDFIQSDAVPN